MRDDVFDEMYDLESRHWWFRAKRRIAHALLDRFVPEPPGRVLDVGCGCGMMLAELAARGWEVAGLDPSEKAVACCAARGVRVTRGTLDAVPRGDAGRYDAALLLDVIEHIDDDRAALESAMRLLRPGGVAIVMVPAWPALFSVHDERHGHRRRYTRRRFRALVGGLPGARVEMLSFMNCALFPLAALSRLAGKLVGGKGSAELRVPWTPVNRLFEALFAAEARRLARGRALPWGLSLVTVLRAQASSPPRPPLIGGEGKGEGGVPAHEDGPSP